jgi:hypothetical protein
MLFYINNNFCGVLMKIESFADIPVELKEYIFSFFDEFAIKKVEVVCKDWLNIIRSSQYIWEERNQRIWSISLNPVSNVSVTAYQIFFRRFKNVGFNEFRPLLKEGLINSVSSDIWLIRGRSMIHGDRFSEVIGNYRQSWIWVERIQAFFFEGKNQEAVDCIDELKLIFDSCDPLSDDRDEIRTSLYNLCQATLKNVPTSKTGWSTPTYKRKENYAPYPILLSIGRFFGDKTPLENLMSRLESREIRKCLSLSLIYDIPELFQACLFKMQTQNYRDYDYYEKQASFLAFVAVRNHSFDTFYALASSRNWNFSFRDKGNNLLLHALAFDAPRSPDDAARTKTAAISLIERNCAYNSLNRNKYKPIDLAVYARNPDLVSLLLTLDPGSKPQLESLEWFGLFEKSFQTDFGKECCAKVIHIMLAADPDLAWNLLKSLEENPGDLEIPVMRWLHHILLSTESPVSADLHKTIFPTYLIYLEEFIKRLVEQMICNVAAQRSEFINESETIESLNVYIESHLEKVKALWDAGVDQEAHDQNDSNYLHLIIDSVARIKSVVMSRRESKKMDIEEDDIQDEILTIVSYHAMYLFRQGLITSSNLKDRNRENLTPFEVAAKHGLTLLSSFLAQFFEDSPAEVSDFQSHKRSAPKGALLEPPKRIRKDYSLD